MDRLLLFPDGTRKVTLRRKIIRQRAAVLNSPLSADPTTGRRPRPAGAGGPAIGSPTRLVCAIGQPVGRSGAAPRNERRAPCWRGRDGATSSTASSDGFRLHHAARTAPRRPVERGHRGLEQLLGGGVVGAAYARLAAPWEGARRGPQSPGTRPRRPARPRPPPTPAPSPPCVRGRRPSRVDAACRQSSEPAAFTTRLYCRWFRLLPSRSFEPANHLGAGDTQSLVVPLRLVRESRLDADHAGEALEQLAGCPSRQAGP